MYTCISVYLDYHDYDDWGTCLGGGGVYDYPGGVTPIIFTNYQDHNFLIHHSPII